MSKIVQDTMTVFHFGRIAAEMFRLKDEARDLFQQGDIDEAVGLAIKLLADRDVLEAQAGAEGARRVRMAIAMLISDFRRGNASNESVGRILARMSEPAFASH